jgi:hypothetical protein
VTRHHELAYVQPRVAGEVLIRAAAYQQLFYLRDIEKGGPERVGAALGVARVRGPTEDSFLRPGVYELG